MFSPKIYMSDTFPRGSKATPGSEFHNSVHPAQYLCVASGPESVLSPCSAKDGSLDLQQLDFILNQQNEDFPQSHLQHSGRK